MDKYNFIAKTFSGLESILEQELLSIGAENVKSLTRGCSFDGDKKLMYRVNYECRTALRVLMHIKSFPVNSEKDLYKNIKEIAWEDYMDSMGSLAIDAVTFHKVMSHSLYVSQLSKDAVVDRFRDKQGHRPSVDLISPDIRIHVHLSQNDCSVLLDSSGEPLFKRGYRLGSVDAPINEVLAAGLIAMTGWKGDQLFFDPMCGSGTFLIEAAMLAANIPCGKYRTQFDFMKWLDFDDNLWQEVQDEAAERVKPISCKIMGTDISRRAVSMANRNIQHVGFEEQISVLPKDFFRTSEPFEGLIITNPPYDERMKIVDTADFYRNIGNIFKNYCAGSEAWIITGNEEAMKSVGLRPSKKIKVFNGKLECRFLKYEMYAGTKKHLDN